MPLFIFPYPKDNIFCLFSPLKVIYFTVFRLNAQHKEKEYPEEEVHLWIDFFQDGQVDATSIFQYTELQLRGYMNTMNSFNNLLGEALSWWRVSEGIYSQFTMSPLNVLTQAKLYWVDTDDPNILSPAMANMLWSRAIGRQ